MPDWFQTVLSRAGGHRTDGPISQDEVSAIRDNANRVALMVRSRWILLLCMASYAIVAGVVAFAAGTVNEVIAGMAVPLNALLLAIAYNFLSDRLRPILATVRHASAIQFTLDILIVALVLVFTGGPESWLWVVYILLIFESATIAHDRGDVWLVAGTAIVAMTIVDWGGLPQILEPFGALPQDPSWANWGVVAQRYALHVAVLLTAAGVSNVVIVSLHEQLARARELAIADEQTGCPSRAAFHAGLETEYARAQRSGRPVYLLLVDIDRLSAINVRFGIEVGDAAIKKVASVLGDSVRGICSGEWTPNSVYRVSGEEFAVLVVDSSFTEDGRPGASEIAQLAEAVRTRISQISIGGVSVTVSVGAAVTSSAVTDAEELLVAADDALANAVASGGNSVVLGWEHDTLAQEKLWSEGDLVAEDDGPGSYGDRFAGPSNPFVAQYED